MKHYAFHLLAILGFGWVGCQSTQRIALEHEYPFEIAEPVFLLKPADFPMADLMAVWAPRQRPPSLPAVPIATIAAIGPENTAPPVLTRGSQASRRDIVDELPANLPRRAVFLISSSGAVVEVAFRGARDRLNERVFAARLRALKFEPAKHAGKPIAVVCEMHLLTGAIGPNKAPEPTPMSVTPPAAQESRRP